jgi:hypothetical protein
MMMQQVEEILTPGSWVKEKNESECHRDCRQNDRNDKQLFPRAESVRAGDENNGDEDVHHEHTPRQSNYRGGGDEKKENRDQEREMSPFFFWCRHFHHTQWLMTEAAH